MFRHLGREIDAGTIVHSLGMGGDRFVSAILGDAAGVAEDAQRLHAEMYLAGGLVRHAVALPGAVELLTTLRRRGARAVLASSARSEELDH